MAELVGPGRMVITTGCTGTPAAGWTVEYDGGAVQMTGPGSSRSAWPTSTTCSSWWHWPDRAPSSPGTLELGGYVGVRSGGRLVAMAGERMRPVGWAEISEVATHPGHRRRGLAEFLVRVEATRPPCDPPDDDPVLTLPPGR